jgi:CheY-like chemotaxis protein
MLVYLGQVPGGDSAVELAEACRTGIGLLRTVMPANVRLIFEFPGWEPAAAGASPGDTQQMLSTLVTNAWEALEGKAGEIRVRLSRATPSEMCLGHQFPVDWQPLADAYACMEVTDNGCGIDERNFENLFEPFYTTKFPGRGMGLPMLLGTLQQRQGVCSIESRVGKGTTFSVYLPLFAGKKPAADGFAAPVSEDKSRPGLLLVDDDSDVLRLVGKSVSRLGYRVFAASGGSDAIEIYRAHRSEIQIVLCDIIMPQVSGWDVVANLRKISPTVPVIMMSGFSEKLDRSDSHTEQAQAFIRKPFQSDALKKVIEGVLKAAKTI